jgi:hypothetical protein
MAEQVTAASHALAFDGVLDVLSISLPSFIHPTKG